MPGTVGRVPAPPAAVSDVSPVSSGEIPSAPWQPWPDTPLGPSARWDPALRAVVELVLASPMAMALAYGDDLALIYNSGYAELIGTKHPAAFGRPAAEVFAEVWQFPGVGEVLERVYRTGVSFLEEETLLPLVRGDSGRTDPAIITRSYCPVRDSTGRIIGLLTVPTETVAVTKKLQSLSELASALSGALTLDDVARVTLCSALSSFEADQVAFGVDDGTGWRTVRRIRDPLSDEADDRLPPVWRRQPSNHAAPLFMTADSGVAHFATDGQPLLPNALDRHDQKVRSLAALPLRTPSLRGALTISYQRKHVWSPTERALLSAAAELVAQAAERARCFETQHGTAQLLQRSMLPEHLPDLPYLRLAARYDVGVDGNAAGGDFYDAFNLPAGLLGVALGDVAGHNVHAAALMGQVRAALRALALGDPDPAGVLCGLDRLVTSLGAETHSDELFVTVVYAVIDPAAHRLTLASAGHPAPLLRRANSDGAATARYLDVPPGVPLGLGGCRQSIVAGFLPGDTLLLFSDGVVERRGQSLTAGLDRLAVAVTEATSGDPRSLCALVGGAVPGTTDDDVAVLAVEHAVAPSRSTGLGVPPEPSAPGRVRRWMTTQLTTWRVPEVVISAAVLCTSELITNALLHAGTAARVEIDLNTERLLISVADRGTRGTVLRTSAETLSSRGRGLGLIEQLSDAWGTDPTVRGSTVWFKILIPDVDS